MKLYSSLGTSAPNNGAETFKAGKVVAYLGIWVAGTLQDVSEVFFMASNLSGSGGVNGNAVTNVVLGCTGNAGDKIDIRLGYYDGSTPDGVAVWSKGKTSTSPASDMTSMIFWKL